jgi:hypothetical protein
MVHIRAASARECVVSGSGDGGDIGGEGGASERVGVAGSAFDAETVLPVPGLLPLALPEEGPGVFRFCV